MNCILYLVDTHDLANFRRSLASIPRQLKDYPILAYHEDSLIEEVRNSLKAGHPQLNFHRIDLTRPMYDEPIDSQIPEQFVMDICSFGLGYRSMCRFFAGEVFLMPELAQYDYALRLDTDSAIVDWGENPFDVMRSTGADYGYRLLCNDHPQCYVNFYKHFERVVNGMGHAYTFPKEEEGWVYYTNFEVLNLKTFKSRQYLELYGRMDATGGYYLHRWGDHVHRYAFARQFGLKTHQFAFDYVHGQCTFPRDVLIDMQFGKA